MTQTYLNTLQQYRKRAGLTQDQVARFLSSTDRTTVARYEAGTRLPSLRMAAAFELLYAAPLQRLFPTLYAEVRDELVARQAPIATVASRPLRLLAVAPGTRTLGVAVIEDGRLLHAGIENLWRTVPLPKRLTVHGKLIVRKLFATFEPTILLVGPQSPFGGKRSRHLKRFFVTLRALAQTHSLKVMSCSPRLVKRLVDGRATNERLAKILAARYPSLQRYLPNSDPKVPGQKRYRRSDFYWFPMFEAVALALASSPEADGEGKQERP